MDMFECTHRPCKVEEKCLVIGEKYGKIEHLPNACPFRDELLRKQDTKEDN